MARMLIWALMLIGGGVLGIWADYRWFRTLFVHPVFHLVTLIIGILLLRLVLRASRITGRLLARLGREGDIARMETNKLVTTGVYSCMRHPMHFGLLFFPWSVALILGSPTFILFIAPLEVLFMLAMIKFVEEPEAIRKFGDAYREYQKRVPGFNLHPDCWRQILKK
ncbi:MAG: isoprenylcysteine carboxylmethyltransferase family protein [Anaerolineaceae bacterium]|nr:isoprenylcysteine carboxylmethyltransferase family protein [Anaerolineaceae bacterium]